MSSQIAPLLASGHPAAEWQSRQLVVTPEQLGMRSVGDCRHRAEQLRPHGDADAALQTRILAARCAAALVARQRLRISADARRRHGCEPQVETAPHPARVPKRVAATHASAPIERREWNRPGSPRRACLRRRMKPRHARPAPSSAIEAGSGTVVVPPVLPTWLITPIRKRNVRPEAAQVEISPLERIVIREQEVRVDGVRTFSARP